MKIEENINLKQFNTFGVDNKALFFVEINSEKDFEELLNAKIFEDNKRLFLGGGSNVLFTRDFDGLIILNRIKGIEIFKENENEIILKVASGEVWHDLVMYSVLNGWYGLENLALIPGTVGASPVQNIGAYGIEAKDTILQVEGYLLETKQKKAFQNTECNFAYRDSIFKNELKDKFFITQVYFVLKKSSELNLSYKPIKEYFENRNTKPSTPKDIAQAVIEIRNSKLPDPKVIGNAGSFFKNVYVSKEKLNELKNIYQDIPFFEEFGKIKIPTGWLIEKAGFKGKRFGNVGVYEKQALVLVNFGGARGEEVLELAQEIINKVKEVFDIEIHTEVNLI